MDKEEQAISFKELVQGCAVDQEILDAFSAIHPEYSSAPILALLSDQLPPDITPEEEQRAARFILWVQSNLWTRLQRAQANQKSVTSSRSQS